MMKFKVLVISVLVIAFSNYALSQEKSNSKFAFELNGGLSIAAKDLNKSNLKPGFGFEGLFQYNFMPHTGLYAGWGWNRFESDKSFAGNDVCFEETGYIIGLQFKHPVGNGDLSYFLRAGALYNHIETENSDGEIIIDTGHDWGWQIDAGIDIPVGDKWSFTPGLKFNSLNRDAVFNSENIEMEYKYISVKIGFNRNF